jgi:hypothetical protein
VRSLLNRRALTLRTSELKKAPPLDQTTQKLYNLLVAEFDSAFENAAGQSGLLEARAWRQDDEGFDTRLRVAAFARAFRRILFTSQTLQRGLAQVPIEVDNIDRRRIARMMKIAPEELPETGLATQWLRTRAQELDSVVVQTNERVARVLSESPVGTPVAEIRSKLQLIQGINRSRADNIARSSVNSLNGEMERARFKSLGIAQGIWRTVKDSDVRHEHEDLEGQRFTIGVGLPGGGYGGGVGEPGSAPRCRCYTEPVIEGYNDVDAAT